jgi:hypothetical protein
VDGIRPQQWDQYPAAISTAFSQVIEKRKDRLFKFWEVEEAQKSQLLEHHDLRQEFEANGRRYYVVFVMTEWCWCHYLELSYIDAKLDWDGPFPGGEDI